MIFEAGLVVGIALMFSLSKMDWKWKLRVLSHPFLIDAIVFLGLIVLHWGTYSGIMVATIGAFTCSTILSAGRWLFGYIEKGKYVPGRMYVGHKAGF